MKPALVLILALALSCAGLKMGATDVGKTCKDQITETGLQAAAAAVNNQLDDPTARANLEVLGIALGVCVLRETLTLLISRSQVAPPDVKAATAPPLTSVGIFRAQNWVDDHPQ